MLKAKKILINEFHLKDLGYDFMGYSLQKDDIFTFHHLIVQAKRGGAASMDNGAILCGKTSHPYIHLVEKIDRKTFMEITKEILEMKRKMSLDIINLKNINELLCMFEEKYSDEENDVGALIIKPEYKIRIFNTQK